MTLGARSDVDEFGVVFACATVIDSQPANTASASSMPLRLRLENSCTEKCGDNCVSASRTTIKRAAASVRANLSDLVKRT